MKQFLFFIYATILPFLLFGSDQKANGTANRLAYALIYHQIQHLISQKNEQRNLLINTYNHMRQEIIEQLLKQRGEINQLINQARAAETLSVLEADKLTESNFDAVANLYPEFPKL